MTDPRPAAPADVLNLVRALPWRTRLAICLGPRSLIGMIPAAAIGGLALGAAITIAWRILVG